MGCWNETCAISNLHIKDNQDVVVFLLTRNELDYDPDFCYNNALYNLLPIPFYAKYDEYGGAFDINGVGLEYIIKTLANNLVEMETGDNKHHDIEVVRSGFTADKIFEYCHENRLFVHKNLYNYAHGNIKVERVMIHKTIFDHIIDNTQYKHYIGDGEYALYTYTNIIADLPECIKRAKAKFDANYDSCDIDLQLFMIKPFGNQFGKDETNCASLFLRYIDGYEYKSPLFNPSKYLNSLFVNNTPVDEIVAFVTEYTKGLVMDDFVLSTRKLWTPQGGKGSQRQEHEPYQLLINAIAQVLDKEKDEDEE